MAIEITLDGSMVKIVYDNAFPDRYDNFNPLELRASRYGDDLLRIFRTNQHEEEVIIRAEYADFALPVTANIDALITELNENIFTLVASVTIIPSLTTETINPAVTVSNAATIAAGAKSISFRNVGTVDVTVEGAVLKRNEFKVYSATDGNLLDAIDYNATGGSLEYQTIT